MKQLFFLFITVFILSACSNNDEDFSIQNENQVICNYDLLDESEAQKEFAIILSQAVYNNEPLRKFIKTEAIRQFDNDHDVFYPYVKNKKVDHDLTFRDLLLSYTNEQKLRQIEESLPLLTILVPDLSFMEAFNVEDWDTSEPEVATTYAEGNTFSTFYGAGDSILSLNVGEIPDFPFMVVKSNERMKVVQSSTRAGEAPVYAFVDEAFNAKSNTGTRGGKSGWSDKNIDSQYIESTEPYLQASEIDPLVLQAYAKYPNNENGCMREYIYYGVGDPSRTQGVLNTQYAEKLYKFKVLPIAYSKISDDKTSSTLDPTIPTNNYTSHKSSELSDEKLIQFYQSIWTTGNYEFVFTIFQGNSSSTLSSVVKYVSVMPTQLFQLKSIRHQKIGKSFWRHSKHEYKVIVEYNIDSKWVNIKDLIGSDLFVFTDPWDLSQKSLDYTITVEEYDKSAEITKQCSTSVQYVLKSEFSTSIEATPIKTTFGISGTETTYETVSYQVKYNEGNDDLGQDNVNYFDPIIKRTVSGGPNPVYEVKMYNTGQVQMIILPAKR